MFYVLFYYCLYLYKKFYHLFKFNSLNSPCILEFFIVSHLKFFCFVFKIFIQVSKSLKLDIFWVLIKFSVHQKINSKKCTKQKTDFANFSGYCHNIFSCIILQSVYCLEMHLQHDLIYIFLNPFVFPFIQLQIF